MINGKYVKLRPFEKSDLEICRERINDPEIAESFLRVLPVSMHEHIQWYEKIISDKSRVTFAIETIKDKRYIGNTGLMSIDWRNRKGKLWIYIDKKFWGKGYGKESVSSLVKYAFNSLNFNKVSLDVAIFNQQAIRLYKSVGFKKDGILREDIFLQGRYIDVLRMSILKSEFFKG
jgi:RimJ/RimL family protein N-acetyltransferase